MIYKCLYTSLVVVLATGCATDTDRAPPPWQDIEMSFEPVGRLVSTDYDYGFRAYAIEGEDGLEYLYNDELRPPDSPAGPLPVDCEETKQIGVWLDPGPALKKKNRLDRSVEIHAKQPRVDVRWSHSERPEGDTRYRWTRHVVFGERFVTRINLAKEDRVDGVMTLNIRKGDEVLYTTSFQLMGCG